MTITEALEKYKKGTLSYEEREQFYASLLIGLEKLQVEDPKRYDTFLRYMGQIADESEKERSAIVV